MPTLDTSAMSMNALSALAQGAREIVDVEAGLVRIDGTEHFVLFFKTEGGDGFAFQTSPVGGVLIHQQLRDLFSTRGGILAVLRQALNTPDAPAVPAVAAAEVAFEGAER